MLGDFQPRCEDPNFLFSRFILGKVGGCEEERCHSANYAFNATQPGVVVGDRLCCWVVPINETSGQ